MGESSVPIYEETENGTVPLAGRHSALRTGYTIAGFCPSPGGIPRFAWDISQSLIVERGMSTIEAWGCGHPALRTGYTIGKGFSLRSFYYITCPSSHSEDGRRPRQSRSDSPLRGFHYIMEVRDLGEKTEITEYCGILTDFE
ncbi:MAG: hypothetical protein LUG99_11840 [Lachnospiraceae bacterium]|nr:hypothetical protein [Lachnospiraceae bacterium]